MVVNRSEGSAFEKLIDKLKQYQESLTAIEDWIEGETPNGLGLAWAPTEFSDLRRAPLSAENLEYAIEREGG